MNIVVFKWNPAISSISMFRYLKNISQKQCRGDWSVWEYEKIRRNDRFFMLKVGYGTTGIVAAGKITSDPETDLDWRNAVEKIHYCKYRAEIIINPETFPILNTAVLESAIPDFDWRGGHSGMSLNFGQAESLCRLWDAYLLDNAAGFIAALKEIRKRDMLNDQLYIRSRLLRKLLKRCKGSELGSGQSARHFGAGIETGYCANECENT